MPRLQQLDCSLLLGRSDIQLPEYRIKYNDSAVECRVACPDLDINFNILLEVNSYLAPGIAVLVYIDGIYQCNRNVALSITAPKALRLRQKEEKLSDGSFVGREWTFTELGNAQPDFKRDRHFEENVGKIEVVVRRCCYDAVKTEKKEKPAKSNTQKPRPTNSIFANPSRSGSVASSGLLGGMLGLFDGAVDCAQYDGTWDWSDASDHYERTPPRSSRRRNKRETYHTYRRHRQATEDADRAHYRPAQPTLRDVETLDTAVRRFREDMLNDILTARHKRRDTHSSSSSRSSEHDSSSFSDSSSSTSSEGTAKAYKRRHKEHSKKKGSEKKQKRRRHKHKKHDCKHSDADAASIDSNKVDDDGWEIPDNTPGSWPGFQAQPEQPSKSPSNKTSKIAEDIDQQDAGIHAWSSKVNTTPDNNNAWGIDNTKKNSSTSASHDGSTSDSSSSSQTVRAMPYWSDWNKSPTTKHITTARHTSHTALRTPYQYAALPGPTVASSRKVEADRGVQVGKGAAYEHQMNRPTYMDSIDAPYAVFTFRYSSRHKLEKILGRKIKKEMDAVVQEAERDRMMGMSKDQMIEELIKYKARRGSDPSANAVKVEQGWGATLSASGKSSKSSKSKASAKENNGWTQGTTRSKSASVKKTAAAGPGVWRNASTKGNNKW